MEKFRDITLMQVLVIMERTPLKRLNDGYLILQEKRKSNIRQFVDTFLINMEDLSVKNIYCALFGPLKNSYDSPWESETTKQSVEDYVRYVRADAADILANR